MKQSNKKKLISMLMTLAFIMGIAVLVYAFEFDDTKGAKDWEESGRKQYKETINKGEQPISFRV